MRHYKAGVWYDYETNRIVLIDDSKSESYKNKYMIGYWEPEWFVMHSDILETAVYLGEL